MRNNIIRQINNNYGIHICIFRTVQTSDNFALVVGLGVGIPLFFIAVLIITIIIIYFIKMRKKNRYNTEDVDRLVLIDLVYSTLFHNIAKT